jgi:hypothetical protein
MEEARQLLEQTRRKGKAGALVRAGLNVTWARGKVLRLAAGLGPSCWGVE